MLIKKLNIISIPINIVLRNMLKIILIRSGTLLPQYTIKILLIRTKYYSSKLHVCMSSISQHLKQSFQRLEIFQALGC
jgi:hypothetical protein